jgi:hypothetical protein
LASQTRQATPWRRSDPASRAGPPGASQAFAAGGWIRRMPFCGLFSRFIPDSPKWPLNLVATLTDQTGFFKGHYRNFAILVDFSESRL